MTAHYGGLSADHLRSFIERVERLEGEKKNISEDIKQVYQEAKSNGFDPKIMKQVIKIRAKDASEREEEEYLLDTYLRAMGMLPEVE